MALTAECNNYTTRKGATMAVNKCSGGCGAPVKNPTDLCMACAALTNPQNKRTANKTGTDADPEKNKRPSQLFIQHWG